MDEKTAKTIAMIHKLASDVGEIRQNCESSWVLLGKERRPKLTVIPTGEAVHFCNPFLRGWDLFPGLEMNDAEIAELRLVLDTYRMRVGKILDGCSVKLSPEIREIQSKIEAELEKIKMQVADSEKRNERKL